MRPVRYDASGQRPAMTATVFVLLNPAIARRRSGDRVSNSIESLQMRDRAASRIARSSQRLRQAFIDWIDDHAIDEGRSDVPYAGLSVFRISSATVSRKEPTCGVTLGVVAQGSKTLRVHGRTLEIDPSNYLVVTREMQYDSTVAPASGLRPFLGVSVTFPPELVAKAMVALADGGALRAGAPMAAFTAPLEAALAEPLSRLLKAVDDPIDRRTLAPLAVEELVFRLLRSDAAAAMRGAIRSTDAGPITEAMRLM